MTDTIFALATGAARAAIAVIRISGPDAGKTLIQLAGPLPRPRYAALRTLRSVDAKVLDRALVLWAPGPASFTGEDQVELHLHGGAAVIKGVTEALSHLKLRPALPGEFTRRAFENGKLDLTEAEAIADLVDAETQAQRDQAMAQLGGGVSRRQEGWRAMLLSASAMLEADIDFPDEELPSGLQDQARALLVELLAELDQTSADLRGEQVRDGYRIALVGAPNAGKSSVLNALIERDAAIVTELAGTTRDVIEVALTIEGFRIVIADTAGIRQSENMIEAEGIRRAQAWASKAALRVLVVDQSSDVRDWLEATPLFGANDVIALNKSDLDLSSGGKAAMTWAEKFGQTIVSCQASTGDVLQLKALIGERVVAALSGSDSPVVTRTRHKAIIQNTADCLRRGLSAASIETLAEDVRLASRALAHLVGEIGAEEVLDGVFGSFCIGK
jgi:tRNA modification GTPase